MHKVLATISAFAAFALVLSGCASTGQPEPRSTTTRSSSASPSAMRTAAASSSPLSGTLRFGVPADEPRLGYRSDGEWAGLAVDLARHLASANKVGATFVQATPDQASSLLGTNQADVILTPESITSSSPQPVITLGPYAYSDYALMVRAKATRTTLAQLSGRAVCVVKSSTAGRDLARHNPGLRVIEGATLAPCIAKLVNKEVEAVYADRAALLGSAHAQPKGRVTVPAHRGRAVSFWATMRVDSLNTCRRLRTTLRSMATQGTWSTIVNRSFPRGSSLQAGVSREPPTISGCMVPQRRSASAPPSR